MLKNYINLILTNIYNLIGFYLIKIKIYYNIFIFKYFNKTFNIKIRINTQK